MKHPGMGKRLLCVVCLLCILCTLLSGCSTAEDGAVTSIRQLDGKPIGVMTGSSFDTHTDNRDAAVRLRSAERPENGESKGNDTLVYMLIFVEEETIEKITNEAVDHLNLSSVL